MAVYWYFLRLHQLVASTQLQVDQTCPMGYILAHILIRRSFKELNQSDTSLMDATGERFEGVVPSHVGTDWWAIISSYLLLRFSFWYRGPPSMSPSSLGIDCDYLIIQSPIKIWSLYPPFTIRFLRRWETCPLHCHGRWSTVSFLI